MTLLRNMVILQIIEMNDRTQKIPRKNFAGITIASFLMTIGTFPIDSENLFRESVGYPAS